MSYGRIEINLLPPEMAPGPAIRYALLINFAVIAVLVIFIVVDSFVGFTKLANAKDEQKALQAQVDAGRQTLQDYQNLVKIRDSIDNYGRLITLASADYVDMPVILDRLSRIVPDGVYVERVTNDRSAGAAPITKITVSLQASRRDPQLLLDTLSAFKADEMFADCFMPNANMEERTMEDVLKRAKLDWTTSGPDLATNIVAPQYSFEIQANVPRALLTPALPVVSDDTSYFAGFSMQLTEEQAKALAATKAPKAPAAGGAGKPPAKEAGSPAAPPSAPPPGVDVAEVH